MNTTPVIFNKIPKHFDSILILQFIDNKLVFVRNKKRKWELTGGKREPGETALQTVIRESYEESGAEIDPSSLKIIGYYRLSSGHTTLISTVDVLEFTDIPESSETVERIVSDKPLSPEMLSWQDNVYSDIFKKLNWGIYE
ncbi:hypothetical protein LH61_01865 [Leuconostoc mesenteroides P45]|uniref:NUDIX domain-containing protein n=1 Tax=Leuconostoc mesenteroides TaxID=1245 RepID=UPI000503D94C|nr:NUDIX domain-containing protein [Leuconostoc mesenteroides]KGB50283.1 hypothetical protein LH61_01865 [Leuconostoc mesenteroides P45]